MAIAFTQNGWRVWEGVEVEGRLRGIRTLFLRFPPSDPGLLDGYDHIYINSLWWNNNDGEYIRFLFQKNKLVTLELPQDIFPIIPDDLLQACHVVVAFSIGFSISIPVHKLELIKPDDEIRLDLAPFLSITSTWRSFTVALPDDYVSDKRLE